MKTTEKLTPIIYFGGSTEGVINTTRSNIKTPSSSRVAKGRSNIKNNRYETEPIIIVIEASNDGVINTTRSNIKTVHD